MKNVFKIFCFDIKAIAKHFFVSAIIISIIILPALYAWFNIYANWDPYGNTGNLSIAVASADAGYENHNKGADVIAELKNNDSINWVFTETTEEAIDGVDSGKYYGAIIIEENFSRNMYDINAALCDDNATVTYYENDKKNAAASKITAAAASSLEHSIQQQYLEVLFDEIFSNIENATAGIDTAGSPEDIIGDLSLLGESLDHYSSAINEFIADSASVSYLLSSAEADGNAASGMINDSRRHIDSAKNSLNEFNDSLNSLANGVNDRISEIEQDLALIGEDIKNISAAKIDGEKQRLAAAAVSRVENLEHKLETLRAILPENSFISGFAYLRQTLDALILRSQQLRDELSMLTNKTTIVRDTADILAECSATLDIMEQLTTEDLLPAANRLHDDLCGTLDSLYPLLDSLSITTESIRPMLDATESTVDTVTASLERLSNLMDKTADSLDRIIDRISVGEDEDISQIIEAFGGSTEKYAKFLSSPVEITTEAIYEADTYGSAMMPFYSVLAIWVGGLILIALLKVQVPRKEFMGMSNAEKFWGRYLLFFILSQLQTAVIMLGNILLLGCQCVSPGMLFLASVIISFVFSLLIYSFTLTFGIIGKALLVVAIVLQVAGSSGSFPIEILPETFRNIYLFFPFPYAINAVREAICGLYNYDIFIYLGKLLFFAALAILVGRTLRGPFSRLTKFVDDEIERTEVL